MAANYDQRMREARQRLYVKPDTREGRRQEFFGELLAVDPPWLKPSGPARAEADAKLELAYDLIADAVAKGHAAGKGPFSTPLAKAAYRSAASS